ncbi:DUF3298 and DUF4163 domain-containing protein [Flagellimonas allohymeniacidonis]|uniref:DUF3298 domain-containing protein n=1 Tax=Flagellimonas allohymeniacidonis TaxID=2517819 RepID=A0A4Q8QBP7_9FLAO|nr:DUF3298 and DUF4163 domain-containing protein [Allomuricauda hymeniacidonis]TAI47775.1 DUF3298 domain-containing protein [Allomuricauda hymeniacidonis]
MKNPIPFFTFLLLLLGCENGNNLTFEPFLFEGDSCEGCPKVEVRLPNALDENPLAETINLALHEEVIAILSFEESEDINSIQKAIRSFSNSYKDLKARFPDESIGWEAKLIAEVIYEDAKTLTIKMDAYTFTGGAHGYSSTGFLNFDKLKAEELEAWELFDDKENFTKYAETKFRIQEKIPQDSGINTTGFMFEGDSFHLPQNLGYTASGLELIYNQYEVASYADGPITLTIPYAEANKYLKRKVVQ